MIPLYLLYLVTGALIFTSDGATPTTALRDIQTDKTRPPLRHELLASIVAFTVALPLWPVAVAWRTALVATRAIRRRHPEHPNVTRLRTKDRRPMPPAEPRCPAPPLSPEPETELSKRLSLDILTKNMVQ
ncbi:MAG: hypothetical protein JO362_22055 [Streptomycetaceae bacterium]|nr:hypothetical protein [Streptomycetaceae bacterium]